MLKFATLCSRCKYIQKIGKRTLSTLHYAVEAVGDPTRTQETLCITENGFNSFVRMDIAITMALKQAVGSPLHTISFKPSSLCGQVFAMSSPKLMAVKSDTFFFLRLT